MGGKQQPESVLEEKPIADDYLLCYRPLANQADCGWDLFILHSLHLFLDTVFETPAHNRTLEESNMQMKIVVYFDDEEISVDEATSQISGLPWVQDMFVLDTEDGVEDQREKYDEGYGKYCVCCGRLGKDIFEELSNAPRDWKGRQVIGVHEKYSGMRLFYCANIIDYCRECGKKLEEDELYTDSDPGRSGDVQTFVIGYRCKKCGSEDMF